MTFNKKDVTLLLTDLTGKIQPKPTEEREKLIQSGVHYSEMLPLEYIPSSDYLKIYNICLKNFSKETANAIANLAEIIYNVKGEDVALVSLARAGTPIGILVKHYLDRKYKLNVPHYTISIIRGRGIDKNAMSFILGKHKNLQFIDGWTGKGAILNELVTAASEFFPVENPRELLGVIADPANITDICGTHKDIPIASSFLNSTVCGLMSRTILNNLIGENDFHGVVFYDNLVSEDRTYEFINTIENNFPGNFEYSQPQKPILKGIEEVEKISREFGIKDINFIKPGIGETTRVLLRRVPHKILIAENSEENYVGHILQLAKEKNVPVEKYPLQCYRACGIIKNLGDI